MADATGKTYTCFAGHHRIAAGDWQRVSLAAQTAVQSRIDGSVLIFDDSSGRLTDVESPAVGRDDTAEGGTSRGRGRPKLGVTAREVTLLPRHWEWLAAQPGGASVTLRRLVEEARRTHRDKDRTRKAQERAYAFMSAVAGDLPEFEEASRALFANDLAQFSERISRWPQDVREYALSLVNSDDTADAE